MNFAFRNEIDVTVAVAADGTVVAVEIVPRARPALTRLFAGKPAASLLAALPRLFSLCSMAHQVAYLSAVEAARYEQADPGIRRRRIAAIIRERFTDLLRGLFVGRFALDSDSADALREIMRLSMIPGDDASGSRDQQSPRDVMSRIDTALAVLGISPTEESPAPGSALARHIADLDESVVSPMPAEQSFLSAADDRNVVERLLADGAAFSDAPELQGRIPETGVWARHALRQPVLPPYAGPAERLKARVAEVARLGAWLAAGGEDGLMESGILESYRLSSGRGAAAVECARGRLYHAVELDRRGDIVRFEFLAPTEWNFHPAGPLVGMLQGAVLRSGRQAEDAVRALVGSFDPCVGFNLGLREPANA